MPAESWPSGVQPSDFPEYSDLQDIAPVRFLGEEEPEMLRQAREQEARATAMANVERE